MFFYTPMLGNRLRSILVLVSSALVMVACGGKPVIDTKESFSVESPYQKRVAVSPATACEGARRALLGDGYVITSASADNVKGRKAYRSTGARSTFIEMDVVCLPEPGGSTLYASGLLSTFEVKKSAAAASLGVSAIGSVSLPIGQSADSMVKTSDETISERGFYQRFFVAVDAVLTRMPPEQTVPGAAGEAGRGVPADAQKVAPQASDGPVIDIKESFSVESPYQKRVAVSPATACEGARRALLGDGYVITSASADNVKGRKAYRSTGARSTFIEMDVVCLPEPGGSTLYASGLLSTFDARKSAADSMAKPFDETISNRDFYRRFFFAVDAVLARMPVEQQTASGAGEGDASPQSPQAAWTDVSQRLSQGTYNAAPSGAQPAAPLDAPRSLPATAPDVPQAVPQSLSESGPPAVQPSLQQESQQTTVPSAPPVAGEDRQDGQDGSSQPLPQESLQGVSQAPAL